MYLHILQIHLVRAVPRNRGVTLSPFVVGGVLQAGEAERGFLRQCTYDACNTRRVHRTILYCHRRPRSLNSEETPCRILAKFNPIAHRARSSAVGPRTRCGNPFEIEFHARVLRVTLRVCTMRRTHIRGHGGTGGRRRAGSRDDDAEGRTDIKGLREYVQHAVDPVSPKADRFRPETAHRT